jgi:hypothetical protein
MPTAQPALIEDVRHQAIGSRPARALTGHAIMTVICIIEVPSGTCSWNSAGLYRRALGSGAGKAPLSWPGSLWRFMS